MQLVLLRLKRQALSLDCNIVIYVCLLEMQYLLLHVYMLPGYQLSGLDGVVQRGNRYLDTVQRCPGDAHCIRQEIG